MPRHFISLTFTAKRTSGLIYLITCPYSIKDTLHNLQDTYFK